MKKITRTLIKLSAGHLQPEEELLAGLRVNLKGTALGIGLSAGAAGFTGLALGSKIMNEGRQQAEDSGIPFSQQMALGLSNQRIIVWSRSAFSGRPKKILGQILLSEINQITFEPGALGDKLKLELQQDKILELESVKVDKGQDFADQLKTLLTTNQ
ncbi:MAG: hypothetical protein QGG42_06200 [Phycisphaerae bacterium]|jgi:hypothetical protein|nr:hypothetical protein [Phycisphaerae bacterium]